jgi:hypothetical protein
LWCVWTASTVSSRGTDILCRRRGRRGLPALQLYADGEEDSEFMVDGNPSSGEDDHLVDRPWMRPSSRTSWTISAPSSRVRPSGSGITCARPTGATITGPLRHHRQGVSSTPRPPRSLTCAAGEKVVCLLEHQEVHGGPWRIHLRAPTEARVKVYNAGTGARTFGTSTRSGSSGLLVYSPSISSGVVRRRALRPPRRVPRQLPVRRAWGGPPAALPSPSAPRRRHLFAQRTLVVLPCETEIDASDGRPRARIQALRDESAHVRSAGPFHADHFEYDKSRMSWHIICGIIQTQNQSAMYFTDVAGRSALIIPFRWSVLACSRPS